MTVIDILLLSLLLSFTILIILSFFIVSIAFQNPNIKFYFCKKKMKQSKEKIVQHTMNENEIVFQTGDVFLEDGYKQEIIKQKKRGKCFIKVKQYFQKVKAKIQRDTVENKERRQQEEIELYDSEEVPQEIPKNIIGKLQYWWKNKISFRIVVCSLVVFLIIGTVLYGFWASGRSTEIDTKVKNTFETEEKKTHTTKESPEEGIKIINPEVIDVLADAQEKTGQTPEIYEGSDTAIQPKGAIGILEIPKIHLKNAPVMPSEDLGNLEKGIGHFRNTPMVDGNVGIAGHNTTHFKYLVNLEIGDEVKYHIDGITRTYKVVEKKAIADTDWGVFHNQGDNRLTLITCEHLVPNRRIAVTAVQIGSDKGTRLWKVQETNTVHQSASTKPKTTKIKPVPIASKQEENEEYHDVGSGYTDYIGVFTGEN